VQLDRIPPRRPEVPGTVFAPSGVEAGERISLPVEPELSPRPRQPEPGASSLAHDIARVTTTAHARLRTWLLLVVGCALLLGQGERFQVDPRFRSPGAVLETYWRAIRLNDLQTVSDCFIEPDISLPFPGMLWFLPPVDKLHVSRVRVASAEADHIVAVYEVLFLPSGTTSEESFTTSSELQRVGHEWRIVPPSGDASMPEWRPYPRPVDS
jgi:hypothetical protein